MKSFIFLLLGVGVGFHAYSHDEPNNKFEPSFESGMTCLSGARFDNSGKLVGQPIALTPKVMTWIPETTSIIAYVWQEELNYRATGGGHFHFYNMVSQSFMARGVTTGNGFKIGDRIDASWLQPLGEPIEILETDIHAASGGNEKAQIIVQSQEFDSSYFGNNKELSVRLSPLDGKATVRISSGGAHVQGTYHCWKSW